MNDSGLSDRPPTTNPRPQPLAIVNYMPAAKSIPEFVAARAAAQPHAPALVSGGQLISYGELDQRANKLAHRLIRLGVGAEGLVALCLDRSVEAVMCALAVMKAGGAYLPMDPGYPTERLAFMLQDAQPLVLITNQGTAEQLPSGSWNVLNIDADGLDVETYPTEAPANDISPEQLAYVIYTSGSTGRPKGVEVTYQSLMNLINWHQQTFSVSNADRGTLLAGVGFDAAIWETWPYLTAGASLYLPDDVTRVSPDLLRDWLVTNEVTISFLPTVLAERIMTLPWPERTALRFLLTGADTLHRYPTSGLPFQLINNYGPTECTVVATSGPVLPSASENGLPTIGRAIVNTQVYILDENLEPVADGIAGELYLGGTGVARGYRNQPELTAAKFLRDPFSNAPGARLYRTGDLARRLEDGEIAYLGRIDDQIKILGYRIEPNEISAVLDRHPAIQTSLVAARQDECIEKRLVAYMVLRSEPSLGVAELRSYLQNELPDYMVPSVFVAVDSLPLTLNGKVDRAALPVPDRENTLVDEQFIAPRTPVEERLGVILTALLGVERVSVNDNFFLLGGHSLLGTQLIGQIRTAFGVDLALRSLFDAPTIADLSREIEQLIVARIANMSEAEAERLLA